MPQRETAAAPAPIDQSGSFKRFQSKVELRKLKAPLELRQIRLQSRLLSLIQQQGEIASALDIVAKASDEVLRAVNAADVPTELLNLDVQVTQLV